MLNPTIIIAVIVLWMKKTKINEKSIQTSVPETELKLVVYNFLRAFSCKKANCFGVTHARIHYN